MPDLEGLPGGELVARGLADLAAGRHTVPALLVAAAPTLLRDLGLKVDGAVDEPELKLYAALCAEDPDGAHGRYNALRREFASFVHALEREQEASRRGG